MNSQSTTPAASGSAAAFLPPGAQEVVAALSCIGYRPEESLADLIDNSIDKGATNVEIRIRRSGDRIVSIHIGDDGFGIRPDEFAESMRLGTRRGRGANDLGHFGLGMKTASLSQTRRFKLVTLSLSRHSGICFDGDEIDETWRHPLMGADDARREFERAFDDGASPASGTVLVWEAPRMTLGTGIEFDALFHETIMRIDAHLGTVFSRQIAAGIRIRIVVCDDSRLFALPCPVAPNDPFDYGRATVPGWPKTFRFEHQGRDLSFVAHIWPYGETTRSFLMGATSGVSRQGLYVYRNGRPIKLGGWSNLVPKGVHPNLSLARIRIDVDGSLDVGMTLQKSDAVLPDALIASMRKATSDGLTLEDYLDAARAEFRRGRKRAMKDRHLPIAPGAGFSDGMQAAMAPDGLHRKIDFAWARLGPDQVFQIDHKRGLIELNETYSRHMTSQGASDPAWDVDGAVTVKVLLMAAFEESLKKTKRLSLKMTQEIDALNRRLLVGYLGPQKGSAK